MRGKEEEEKEEWEEENEEDKAEQVYGSTDDEEGWGWRVETGGVKGQPWAEDNDGGGASGRRAAATTLTTPLGTLADLPGGNSDPLSVPSLEHLTTLLAPHLKTKSEPPKQLQFWLAAQAPHRLMFIHRYSGRTSELFRRRMLSERASEPFRI
eukprot:2215405-Pyramimonas_sp.AAC.1